MIKKISWILVACLMVCGISLGSSAAEIETHVFYYANDKEVVVEGANLDYEEMQYIADFVANDISDSKDETSICGLTCSLFGHSLTSSSATETQHNAYTTSPKCLKKTYKVNYCTRSSCDYITKELISSVRTSACHG